MNKQEYLQTEHWQRMRAAALERAGHRCQVCNAAELLDVHHRTYERVGREDIGDLTVLCGVCHDLFHGTKARVPEPVQVDEAMLECLTSVDGKLSKVENVPCGMSTGFVDLDDKTDGIHRGHLIVLGSRAGVGKTAFALNLARFLIEDNHSVLFISTQESRQEIAASLLRIEARVDSQRLRSGRLTNDDIKRLINAAAVIRSKPLQIIDAPSQSLESVSAAARKVKASGLDVLFVDALQSLDIRRPSLNWETDLARSAKRFKQLARELEIAVVLCSRVRSNEDRQDHRPRLSDVRAIEGDADVVLFLHRPELYQPGLHDAIAEIIIAKQRGGPTGEVSLTFIKQVGRFDNFATIPDDHNEALKYLQKRAAKENAPGGSS